MHNDGKQWKLSYDVIYSANRKRGGFSLFINNRIIKFSCLRHFHFPFARIPDYIALSGDDGYVDVTLLRAFLRLSLLRFSLERSHAFSTLFQHNNFYMKIFTFWECSLVFNKNPTHKPLSSSLPFACVWEKFVSSKRARKRTKKWTLSTCGSFVSLPRKNESLFSFFPAW